MALHHALRASIQTSAYSLSAVGSVTGSTSSSGSLSVTYPTGITAGDLIFVCFIAGDASSVTPPPITTPSGYTLLFTQGGYNTANIDATNMGFYYKIAAGTESGSFTMTATGGTFRSTYLVVFRKSVGVISSIVRAGTTQQGSAGTAITPSTQTVTNSSGIAPLIVVAGFQGSSAQVFTPSGTNLTVTGSGIIYRIDNTLNSNTTVSMTATGTTQIMASFYLQVT